MLGRRQTAEEVLRCSFCRKSQDVVGRLLSNPSDYTRAYICDECVTVRTSIVEDDMREREASTPIVKETSRFLHHPLAAEFLLAAENWAVRDRTGWHVSEELDHMRALASRMLTEDVSSEASEL